ncbi:MAG: FAD-dependent oxidoreductase [Actinomycetota bacterium]
MSGQRVLVAGGGLVGLSCAWFLREAGFEVVVLERGAPGGGASRGNAGAICPSMAEPLPAPGMIRHALANLTRPDAALHVHPAYAPRMARFLRWFRQAATQERFDAGLAAMADLASGAIGAYDALAAAGVGTQASRAGYVLAHTSWGAAEEERAAIARAAEAGLCAEPSDVLDGEDVRELEPILSDAVRAGVYLPEERSIDPSAFVDELAAALRDRAVEGREDAEATAVRDTSDGVAVDTPGGTVEGDRAVVAAGVWTRDLVAPLGLSLPLYPGKGYSFAVRPDPMPTHVLSFGAAHVMATPMDGRLRVAGTMEFDGTTERFNARRVEAIVRALAPFVQGVDLAARDEEWVGPRPITPDGLPFLGPVPGHERVLVVAGHNMLGLTLAPVTGRVVASLLADGDVEIDLAPFAPARYG